MLKKYLAEFIWLFLLFYLLTALSPAFFYKAGLDNVGKTIHSVFRIFCHQRVERSPFLFGEKGLINYYSLDELQFIGFIPDKNPHVPEALSETIFAYPYIGNEYLGYKTALCIRDLGIYFFMVIVGGIYLLYANITKKTPHLKWYFIILLMVPMAVDGIFQTFAEFIYISWVPQSYFDDIPKRIITGGLFGVGFAFFVFQNLKENLEIEYNSNNKDD